MNTGGPRADAGGRVTGAVRYTDDLVLPRMAHAKFLRSPHPHARILAVDASEALAMPGVFAVLTGDDLPVRYGAIPASPDETALALGKVRYVGEPVACVAAVDETTAFEACRRVRVVYDPLPAVLDVDAALAPGAPRVHEDHRRGNVLRRVAQSYGDVDGGFAASDLVLEDWYDYPGSTHVPLEPQAALASVGPDGRLAIWTSTQNVHYVHRTLAAVLGLRPADVRLIKPAVGAGYGGKCDLFATDVCTAVLARRLGRPVKACLEREEVFYAHRGRHPTRMRLKVGARADGTLCAAELEAWADGGAYASYGVVTSWYLGCFLTLPYRLPAARFTTMRLYTNKPPCGPKRGHGAVQPRFAFEVHLDRIADKLGIDPADIRLRNAVEPGTETVNGLRVTSCGLRECLETVIRESGWRERRGKLGPGRGLGIAASAYMSGALHAVYPNELPHSAVRIDVDRHGRVTLFSGTAEIGQGSNQVLAALVSERLGLSPSDVVVVEGDTDLAPVDLGSYSSRVTFMAGNAALQAAKMVRERVGEAVAARLGCRPDELVWEDRTVGRGDSRLPWEEAAALAEAAGGPVGATGAYTPPKIASRFRQGVGPSPAFSFGAQVAEVAVDEESGVVRVERVWAAHDLGRTLHRPSAEGQVEGCVYMGVGEALSEEQCYDDGGRMRTPSILEYRIPTVHETPEIRTFLVESNDPEGPLGAKEAGEGPQLPTVPAIANAIRDATGIVLRSPPFTPDRMVRAIRDRDRAG